MALKSNSRKVMLKILQARLQQYVNHELPDVQAGFRKGRGTTDQIAKSAGSSKKQESSRKTSISALLTMPKPLTVWATINCGIFWKRWDYHLTSLLRNLYAGQEATVRTGHGTTDWLVITFLPRSKHLLISWLQSPTAVILEPPKIKSDTVSTVSHLFAMKWWDQMPWS